MNELNFEQAGLYRLKDLDNYKVARRYYDVRGWNVLSSNKNNIGVVNELIVDLNLMRAVYLDIYLHEDIKIKNGTRHLFIPASSVNLDGKKESVILNDIKTITFLKRSILKSELTETEDIERKTKNNKEFSRIAPPVSNYNKGKLINEDNFYTFSKEKKLKSLKKADSSITENNSTDIRGLSVATSDGIKIGIVDDLFTDEDSNAVHYFTVKIDEGPIFEKERYILIPIELADLYTREDKTIQIKIDINEFVNYPPYKGESIDEYEKSLLSSFRDKENTFF
jgi:sporulation protein YlmC with PRC-barrel domain